MPQPTQRHKEGGVLASQATYENQNTSLTLTLIPSHAII
jgi:hypothetical protein